MTLGDFIGCRVFILSGKCAGHNGVCVGKSTDGILWAVLWGGSNEMLQLEFEKEFGLVIDLPDHHEKN
jgi:hypothetical protein